ncbi:MAG: FAD-binding oxidoreductase, partial [Gammaproteobacteria bacterium]|nr:FAD-binding oxidoreductase [Gammaproteobacteria bacterium]
LHRAKTRLPKPVPGNESASMDYIASYYTNTLIKDAGPYPPLAQTIDCDCCIIGGGIAGLSVARELLQLGRSVVVLESNRVAWGASGRNGGFVGPGFALSYSKLCRSVGEAQARELYRLSIDGVQIIKNTIASLDMQETDPVSGQLEVIRHQKFSQLRNKIKTSALDFGLQLAYLDKQHLREHLQTEKYQAAIFNPLAFQIHPLNYCVQLARSIVNNSGRLYEQSPVLSVNRHDGGFRITTGKGRVSCKQLVYCTSAYTGDLQTQLARSILPISTHVVLSKPLGPQLHETIRSHSGVLDDRRASDYYRIVGRDRLLWGGAISSFEPDPRKLAARMRKRILQVYPQLQGLEIELSWTGNMGYARHLMPLVGRLKSGAWACTAFGGHGLNTSSICGQLIARAIVSDDSRYKLFEPFGFKYNYGGIGRIATQLTYWAYQLGDWLDESFGEK